MTATQKQAATPKQRIQLKGHLHHKGKDYFPKDILEVDANLAAALISSGTAKEAPTEKKDG